MGTNIKLQVGEWYETREGKRCYVIGDIKLLFPSSIYRFAVVFPGLHSVPLYRHDGGYTQIESHPSDIVKHLPGCTGWGWKESKWRPAELEDCQRTPPLKCRVRDYESSNWQGNSRYLIGWINPSRRDSPWTTSCNGTIAGWKFCEVLDTPALPSTAIEGEVKR